MNVQDRKCISDPMIIYLLADVFASLGLKRHLKSPGSRGDFK